MMSLVLPSLLFLVAAAAVGVILRRLRLVDPTVYGLVIGAIAVAGVFWLNRSHRWSPIELSIFFAFAVSGALGLGLFVALSSPDQFKAPSKAR